MNVVEREDPVILRIEEAVTDVEATESLAAKALIMRRVVRQQAMAVTIGEEEATGKTEIDVQGEDLARIRAQINRRHRVLLQRTQQPPQPRMITNSEAAQLGCAPNE